MRSYNFFLTKSILRITFPQNLTQLTQTLTLMFYNSYTNKTAIKYAITTILWSITPIFLVYQAIFENSKFLIHKELSIFTLILTTMSTLFYFHKAILTYHRSK